MSAKTIRDIIKKDEYYRKFHIHDCRDHFALIMSEKHFISKYPETMRIDISSKRLIQLANDILTHCDQKAKIKEWKPSNEEFESALERKYGNCAMDHFIINWIRKVVSLNDEDKIKQARQVYEWLKSNEDWLYNRKV